MEETVNGGEPFVIAKSGKPLVKVVPIDAVEGKPKRRIGFDNPSLSDRARDVIEDPENTLFFSVVSIWEIVIKSGLGRDDFDAIKDHDLAPIRFV